MSDQYVEAAGRALMQTYYGGDRLVGPRDAETVNEYVTVVVRAWLDSVGFDPDDDPRWLESIADNHAIGSGKRLLRDFAEAIRAVQP